MAQTDFDPLIITINGTQMYLLMPKGTSCSARPVTLTPEQIDSLIEGSPPAVQGFQLQAKNCEIVQTDRIGQMWFFRNTGTVPGEGSYDNLSIFLDAASNGKEVVIQLQGRNGTVVKTSPSTKPFEYVPEGVSKPGLFPGKVNFQTLFGSDAKGDFTATVTITGTSLKKVFHAEVTDQNTSGLWLDGPGSGTITQPDNPGNPGGGNPGTGTGEESEYDSEYFTA